MKLVVGWQCNTCQQTNLYRGVLGTVDMRLADKPGLIDVYVDIEGDLLPEVVTCEFCCMPQPLAFEGGTG